MASGYPDWSYPIIWVTQEGELWPISEWVAKQGIKKYWRLVDTVAGMATDIHALYTVPANKKLYVASAIFSNDVNMRHELYYTPASVHITDFYQGPYVANFHHYAPPEPIAAGETLYVALHNLTAGAGGALVNVLAWESDV